MDIKIAYISFTIPKNRKWEKVLKFRQETKNGTPVDFTGATIIGEVRRTASQSSELVKAFVITHNDSGGDVTLVMDNSVTPVEVNAGYMDIVVTPGGGDSVTYVQGDVTFIDLPTELP